MKNFQKFVTAQERAEAFGRYWREFHEREILIGDILTVFAWLDLKAEEEKPLPCPFCGYECRCEKLGDVNNVECQNSLCNYQSGGLMSKQEAIAAHNRVAKKCREGKE